MGDETKPTPARELRDALAEALWRSTIAATSYTWDEADEALRAMWRVNADLLLASLPSVKLKMGWEE